MYQIFNNKNGSALIGLLLALVIITALAYGSSFFWKNAEKNTDETDMNAKGAKNLIDTYKEAREDMGEINQTMESRRQMAEIMMIENLDQIEWDVLNREEEGFSINYPHGWYYTINHEAARELGHELIIGFGASEAVWEQKPPYAVALIISSGDKELGQGIKYSVVAARTDDLDYHIATTDSEFKRVVNKISESLKLIKN